MEEIRFHDFLETVGSIQKELVEEIHEFLTGNGCSCEVKTSKSGYVISYILQKTKKTLANFVCRKTGVKIRIYPQNLSVYEPFLDTLPDKMKKDVIKSSVCKRLLNPDDCNPKCKMGYDFYMDGERYQKCKYMAFMPAVNEENTPFIKNFLEKDICLEAL